MYFVFVSSPPNPPSIVKWGSSRVSRLDLVETENVKTILIGSKFRLRPIKISLSMTFLHLRHWRRRRIWRKSKESKKVESHLFSNNRRIDSSSNHLVKQSSNSQNLLQIWKLLIHRPDNGNVEGHDGRRLGRDFR